MKKYKYNLGNSMKSTIPIILFIFITMPSMINAEEITWVKYGWQAFRNSGDASTVAVGGALTAYSNGSASILSNPAHIHYTHPRPFVFAHQNRLNGVVGNDLISMRFNSKSFKPIGLTILHEGVSNILDTRSSLLDWGLDGVPNTGDLGEGNGLIDEGERLDVNRLKQFSQHQYAIHFTSGWSIGKYQFGGAVKGLIHTLGEYTGSGFGLDIGMTKQIWPSTTFGLTVFDIITSWIVWDNGSKEITSPTVVVGGSHKMITPRFPIDIVLIGDILIHTEGKAIEDDFIIGSIGGNYRLGTEITINKQTVIRFGKNEVDFYAAGLGIKWDVLDINYAYQISSLSSELGDSHILSFSMNTEWFIQKVIESIN